MDVHPTKNGINRYWSIPICEHMSAFASFLQHGNIAFCNAGAGPLSVQPLQFWIRYVSRHCLVEVSDLCHVPQNNTFVVEQMWPRPKNHTSMTNSVFFIDTSSFYILLSWKYLLLSMTLHETPKTAEVEIFGDGLWWAHRSQHMSQWIGLRENLNRKTMENPMIFMGKSMVSG